MMVGDEGFKKPTLLHDHKTRAIDQTSLLVRALGEQPPLG
jgi:hypothetical protein